MSKMEKFWWIMLTSFLAIVSSLLTSFINDSRVESKNTATKQELKEVVIDYKKADEKIQSNIEYLNNNKVDKSDFKEIKDQIKFLYEEEVKKANRR